MASSSYLTISLAALYLKNGRTDEALNILEENDRTPPVLYNWKCNSCGKTYRTNLGFCRVCSSYNSIQKDETTQ